jgi:hypothetical protein
MQFQAFAPRRLTLAALCTGGLLLSEGCRSDELQGPGHAPEARSIPAMAEAPTSGLVGEWKLDETSGTNANDSKNNFDATVFGGAAFVAGKLGNALNLNNGTAGTGGKYAQMPSNATLDNVNEANYTLSAWFQPATIPTDAVYENRFWAIVVKANPHFGIFYSSTGKFLARHYTASPTGPVGEQAASPSPYPEGAWYHLAATVSKTTGTVKLYVNGAFSDQASFTAGSAAEDYGTTPWQIGRAGPSWAADGKIDQVRIYNRELSAAEIADLFNETPPQPPDAALPAGLWGLNADNIGTLPSTTSFFKGAAMAPYDGGGPDNIDAILSKANQYDVTLVLRLSGGPGLYTDPIGTYTENGVTKTCSKYNSQKFRDNLDRFVGNQALSNALASRQAIVMAIDEPWIASYCQSIPPDSVNKMGAYIKSRWPGAIVAVRAPAGPMVAGWEGHPAVNWTKIDYGWSQYNHVAAVPENQTPAVFFAGQKDSLNNMADVGMIPGINVWNGGNKACWTQPNGTLGRIRGSQEPEGVRGTTQTCSQVNEPAANSENWVASPALLKSAIDAAVTDADAPVFLGWTHVGQDDIDHGVSWAVMDQYETRSDFVNAFKYWNTKGASRATFNGWRAAK